MFCSECGHSAQGKFCSHCGTRLPAARPDNAQPVIHVLNLTAPPTETLDPSLPVDRDNEVRYEALLQIPRVRETISRHAGMAEKRLSGEDFLKLCDQVAPMAPRDRMSAA